MCDVVGCGRVGQDLPERLILHGLGQLHQDRVTIGVLDGKKVLEVDTELWKKV